jgi:hypothetical protein
MEEFGGTYFNFFKNILIQLSEVVGKGQGVIKSRGMLFFQNLYFYMGPSLLNYLDGLTRYQLQEFNTFMKDNPGECLTIL